MIRKIEINGKIYKLIGEGSGDGDHTLTEENLKEIAERVKFSTEVEGRISDGIGGKDYDLEIGTEYKFIPNTLETNIFVLFGGKYKELIYRQDTEPFTLKVIGSENKKVTYEYNGELLTKDFSGHSDLGATYASALFAYNFSGVIYRAVGDGKTPYIGDNGNWWIGETDTGVKAEGKDGKDGYTPIKGVDYDTEADKSEFSQYIASELAKRGQLKPEPAQTLADMTDTSLLYVLLDKSSPDYGYIFTNVYTEITVEPTNAIPKSTDTDRKTIFNGKGYQLGLRINSSGVVTDSGAPAEMGVTGFIPAKMGDTLEASNYNVNTAYTTYIAAYNSANECTGKRQLKTTDNFPIILDSVTFGTNFNAVRISGNLTDVTSIINKSEGGTTSGYAWKNTGLAFVPADYEDRIIELETEVDDLNAEIETLNYKLKKVSIANLSVSEVFAPSPQLPADGSVEGELNGDWLKITPEQIYAYIDVLLSKYSRFITKEVIGKDASGTHDWCRYILSRRAYDAWQKPNYPPMYAWVNGSTVIYSESVSPRIDDTLYTTKYIGTAKGTVTAVDNKNQSRTVDGVVYTRDRTKDVEPTLVYTDTTYSPYFVNSNSQYDNSIYDETKSKVSTISTMADGILTDANGVAYKRYPLGDRNSKYKAIPAIVIGGNEHGTSGDPAMPAITSARMIKDLCECKNMNNPMLNLLKNEYMMVFCPVVNPWGLHYATKSYYNSNGVNLDRNFDTPGWGNDTTYPQGDYGGSEAETQYFMNTLVASKCKIAMCNHSLGHDDAADNNASGVNREASNAGFCNFMFGRNNSKYDEAFGEITEVMSANYNLRFFRGNEAPPESYAKTRSYIDWIGAEGGGLEMQSRDGFILDPDNEAQGKQFTAGVMEAAYTQLLQVLYMLIDKNISDVESLDNPIFGIVDENNNIIVSGKLADGTYSVKYEMEDGSTVDIGNLVLDTNVYYSVTKNLTQCSISNNATQVVEGESYSAMISANDGYELKSVTVTMGGSSVTVTNGVINIASVMGNIVITAMAEEIVTPTYTNLIPTLTDIDLTTIYNGVGYKENTRISISNISTSNPTGEKAEEGATLLGMMPLGNDGDVLHLRGAKFWDMALSSFSGLIWYYDVNGELLNTSTVNTPETGLCGTDANGDAIFTLTHSKMNLIDGTAYIRFNIANPTGELIMTRNQLIPQN